MTRTHKAVPAKAQRLTVRQVQAALRQEAQAWALLRGLRWGHGRIPLCPRCSQPCWADDSRNSRKRWECQSCPRNPRNLYTTKFSDAVDTPFDRTHQSLALTLLLFAYGGAAWTAIKEARIPVPRIPTQGTLLARTWRDNTLFRRLRREAMRLRSQQFDLSQRVRHLEIQAARDDERRRREIKKRYDQRINILEQEITDLAKKMQEEIRSLRRYRPIGSAA